MARADGGLDETLIFDSLPSSVHVLGVICNDTSHDPWLWDGPGTYCQTSAAHENVDTPDPVDRISHLSHFSQQIHAHRVFEDVLHSSRLLRFAAKV